MKGEWTNRLKPSKPFSNKCEIPLSDLLEGQINLTFTWKKIIDNIVDGISRKIFYIKNIIM